MMIVRAFLVLLAMVTGLSTAQAAGSRAVEVSPHLTAAFNVAVSAAVEADDQKSTDILAQVAPLRPKAGTLAVPMMPQADVAPRVERSDRLLI